MPTVTFEHATIRALQARQDIEHDPAQWAAHLSNIGCVVESCDDELIEVEVFPDRPDLLAAETMTHAVRSFLCGQPAEPSLAVRAGEIEMSVDASLADIRPVILGAVVRGVDTGATEEERERFIQGIMDHQEKLHLTLGRRRRSASIGVHDLTPLAPPFRVTTVPGSHRFVPLGMSYEMSVDEILERHPKGAEYAHLLAGFDRFPVILDRYDRVLSLPPIINGDHTTVNHATSDFFIDVTGWDERACEACLLLVCLSLSMRGGTVESVSMMADDGRQTDSPNGTPRRHLMPEELLWKLLGRRFSEAEVAEAIRRMGGRLVETRTVTDGPLKATRWADTAVGERQLIFEMPRWRADIMHPVDLVEEIAIGIGYEALGEARSALSIEAVPLPQANLHRRLRGSLQSQGLQEVQSLTLSSDSVQFDGLRWNAVPPVTRIANPINTEHTILRQRILPSLLELLAANRHHELPQRVFELGEVVRRHHNRQRLAWACAETAAGFTVAKGLAQAVLRDLGCTALGLDVTFAASEVDVGPWLAGRAAIVLVNGEKVGEFGEIDPVVCENLGLKVPIHGAEFDVAALAANIPDPVL